MLGSGNSSSTRRSDNRILDSSGCESSFFCYCSISPAAFRDFRYSVCQSDRAKRIQFRQFLVGFIKFWNGHRIHPDNLVNAGPFLWGKSKQQTAFHLNWNKGIWEKLLCHSGRPVIEGDDWTLFRCPDFRKKVIPTGAAWKKFSVPAATSKCWREKYRCPKVAVQHFVALLFCIPNGLKTTIREKIFQKNLQALPDKKPGSTPSKWGDNLKNVPWQWNIRWHEFFNFVPWKPCT